MRNRRSSSPSSSHTLPRNGMSNSETRDRRHQDHVEQPHQREGQRLADDQLDRADRRHHQLLHRADLLLAHDGQRGEHERHHHDDVRQHAGHEIVAAAQVRIEPDAASAAVEPREVGDGACSAAARSSTRVEYRRHHLRRRSCETIDAVFEFVPSTRTCTLVGLAALDVARRSPAAREPPPARRRRSSRCCTSRSALRERGHLETSASPANARTQLAALRRPVQVHPGDAGVLHVQVHGDSRRSQLDMRRQEQHDAHARLAQRLQEFLADDLSDSFPHSFTPSSASVFRVARRNTMQPRRSPGTAISSHSTSRSDTLQKDRPSGS